MRVAQAANPFSTAVRLILQAISWSGKVHVATRTPISRLFLSQKSIQIFVLPATRPLVAMKPLFSTVEFVRMNAATTGSILLLRYDRVKHLVIDDVFEKPRRNKRRIEQWMNPDDTVLFLDRTKYKVFFRGQFSLTSPSDAVAAKGAVKILSV